MLRRALAIALVGSLALVGCRGGGEEGVGGQAPDRGTPTPAPLPEGEPLLMITRPADGSTVAAGDVEVRIVASGFRIINKMGQRPAEGEGHVHYYFDVEDLPTTPGRPAVVDDESKYRPSTGATFTWEDVRPGRYTFGAQLVNNDHTPLDPPATAQVTVTVQ